MQPMISGLSDSEMDELENLLENEVCSKNGMPVDVLDGFFYALSVGPVTVMPREWLPKIWGTDEAYPSLKNEDKVDRLLELIERNFNSINASISSDTAEPEFVFPVIEDNNQEYYEASGWAVGFMQGVSICLEAWSPLIDDPDNADMLAPIFVLASTAFDGDEENELARTPQQRHELALQIPDSVKEMHTFWLPFRQAISRQEAANRSQLKIGRNEACPCLSGKKYKKCCGAPSKLH
jgi:uncharacterized protein